MNIDLKGKVALVTGGGRGIGREISLELARKGASVAVVAQTENQINQVTNEIVSNGGQSISIPTNISVPGEVESLITNIENQLGYIDILVNNAGIRGPVGFIQNIEDDEFLDVMKTNIMGTFLCIKYVLPRMIELEKGRIINFSGGGAWTGIRGGGPYGASKSAVEGLTRTVALEAKRFGITCNAIQPGRVDTDSFPILPNENSRDTKSVGPEHAARCIAWLSGDGAQEVTGLTVNSVEWDRLVTNGEDPNSALQKTVTTVINSFTNA